jgi:hypothetical protein
LHEVRHSSESAEHYTPPEVVGLAHRVLGRIDLDPASSEQANSYIEADTYFDVADDGFGREWFGRVLLNPPGGLCDRTGRPVYPKTKRREGCSVTGACGLPPGHTHHGVTSSARAWWFRLMTEVFAGRVEAALFVGFTLEILQSAQGDAPEVDWVSGDALPPPSDFATLVPRRRLRYLAPRGARLVRGDQPPHASFLTYVGPSSGLPALLEAEAALGRVVVPHAACPRNPRGNLCREARGWCRREHAA